MKKAFMRRMKTRRIDKRERVISLFILQWSAINSDIYGVSPEMIAGIFLKYLKPTERRFVVDHLKRARIINNLGSVMRKN